MLSQWFLVGAGRCGLQLARAMAAAGVPVVGIEARSRAAGARVRRACPGTPVFGPDAALPLADAILVAVPDQALAACVWALAPRLHPATRVAVHTSGLCPAEVLRPLSRAALHVGAMHPLASFTSATGPAVRLDGVAAAVEGDPVAVREARRLARALGMRPVGVAPEVKARYHAAAVMAANLTHVLVATSRDLLVGAGFSKRGAAEALRPLVRGAVEAALRARGMENLTGPIARGDARAVRTHLEALPGEAAAAYRAVAGLALVALTSQKLLSESQIRQLERALTLIPYCASFDPLA